MGVTLHSMVWTQWQGFWRSTCSHRFRHGHHQANRVRRSISKERVEWEAEPTDPQQQVDLQQVLAQIAQLQQALQQVSAQQLVEPPQTPQTPRSQAENWLSSGLAQ